MCKYTHGFNIFIIMCNIFYLYNIYLGHMKPKGTNTNRKNSSKKYQSPKKVKSEHKEFMVKIGTKLQEIRKDKNISISFLSHDLGISRNAYSQMERGIVYFSLLNLMKILDYFGKDVEHFFRTLSKH